MSHHHLTDVERRLIAGWRQDGNSPEKIAKNLKRSPSTIRREIARNSAENGYDAEAAHVKARGRLTVPRYTKFTREMAEWVVTGLEDGLTPNLISKRAKAVGIEMVSGERLYQYIYAEAAQGGRLYTNLPRAKRKRRRRCPTPDRRGRIRNRVPIESRPASAGTRMELGHWEGDLIVGKGNTGFLVTLVERRSLYTLVGKTDSKKAEDVTAVIIRLFREMPRLPILTITFDNGKEFAGHEEITRQVLALIYFANPYHSWERGSNENTNGLIRRTYPKGSSFAAIGRPDTQALMARLNRRPRECLAMLTPDECMMWELTKDPSLVGRRGVDASAVPPAPAIPAPDTTQASEKKKHPRLNHRYDSGTIDVEEVHKMIAGNTALSLDNRSRI